MTTPQSPAPKALPAWSFSPLGRAEKRFLLNLTQDALALKDLASALVKATREGWLEKAVSTSAKLPSTDLLPLLRAENTNSGHESIALYRKIRSLRISHRLLGELKECSSSWDRNTQRTFETMLLAREAFLVANEGLVRLLVEKSKGARQSAYTDESLDLLQEGRIQLLLSLDRYRPELRYAFSTYLEKPVRGSVQTALRNHRSTAYYPEEVWKDLTRSQKAFRELQAKLKRNPTEDELAAHLKWPLHKVHDIEMLGPAFIGKAIPVEEGHQGAMPEQDEDITLTMRLRVVLKSISPIERTAFLDRHLRELPATAVARKLGISPSELKAMNLRTLSQVRSSLSAPTC